MFLISLKEIIEKYELEILIIDDGSPIEDFKKLELSIRTLLNEKTKLFRSEKNLGKGGAIEFGIQKSKGEILAFLDADGSISKEEVKNCLDYFLKNQEIDLLMTSRIKMLGKTVKRSFKRHFSGRVFITFFNFLFSIPAYDTQCGFKVFKKEKFEMVKTYIQDKRWTWDTELVILFCLYKFNVIEFPVSWKDTDGSKINLLNDSWKMFYSLLKFKKYLKEKKLI